jgi:hypothetical protein
MIELTIDDIKYFSYACNCTNDEEKSSRNMTMFNLILAKISDKIEYQDVSVMKKSSYFNQNEIQVVSDETLKM